MTPTVGLVHSGSAPDFPLCVDRVTLAMSDNPGDWIGRLEELPDGEWRISAADFAVDRITGKTHLRSRSHSDRLIQLARQRGWTGIHHYGVTGQSPLISAVAAAELELPLLLSFTEGEAETALFTGPADLRSCLRAAGAFTAPSTGEAALVSRFGATPSVVVPPRVIPVEIAAADDAVLGAHGSGPWLGCWGRHGRVSGLSVLLDLVGELQANLLLVGPFESSEMYDWSPRIDNHSGSERILRAGVKSAPQALGLLRSCDLAVFPMVVSTQAHYALTALAGGAKVLASRVGTLADVPGLRTVGPEQDWARAVREALSDSFAPDEAWLGGHSAELVEQRWKQAYELAGLCT